MDRELAPLPAPMAGIIGRESDIERARLVVERKDVRLVTLTGPPGVGKTRLALEVGAESCAHFGGNVSFIPLATLSDTNVLIRAIASALGVTDSVDPVVGLRKLAPGNPWLIVLDNLEQLPDAGVELARLLKGVGELTILATSRKPVEMYGEYLFPIDPLPVPGPGDDHDALASNPAIELLADSARSANLAFEFAPLDYQFLAEIARRVDGLPLALELAGAYVPLLGARGVLDALDDTFSVLGDGPRDMPARLQTMRDAIAWSYDLLTAEEQALFRRLSVFTGGFTFEMAEAIARGWQPEDGYPYLFGLPTPAEWMLVGKEGPDYGHSDWSPAVLSPIETLPLAAVNSLVKQNLIRPVHTQSSIDRFELLETIREFGLEQLADHGETDAARHAHAVIVTAIAELCGVAMWREEWRPALAWIEAELPNIRAAISWLATQPKEANQLQLRLTEGLWTFWQSRGYASEGSAHLEAALARPGGTLAARASALNLLGALSWIRNDLERAMWALDEALPILQLVGYKSGLGRNFLFRSLVAWNRHDFDRMVKMAQIAKAHFREARDTIGEPMCSLMLGVAARARGDHGQAAEYFDAAYHGCADDADGGFIWGMGVSQYYLGEVARQEGDRVLAVSHLRAALEILLDLGDPWTVGGCVGTLAIYLVEDGELEEAARLLGAAHGLESSSGVFLPPTETATHESAAADVRGRIGPDAFSALFEEGRAWSMDEAAAHAMLVPMESAAARAARAQVNGPLPDVPLLPDRYLRTLRLRAAGRNVKEIAVDEGIAISSVYERFDRIKEQLGLDPNVSQAELMVHAVRVGIV